MFRIVSSLQNCCWIGLCCTFDYNWEGVGWPPRNLEVEPEAEVQKALMVVVVVVAVVFGR